jgi:uncharacterized protein (TIGR03437 family)
MAKHVHEVAGTEMRLAFIVLSIFLPLQAISATFGTPVVIGGHASDIALDRPRGLLYIANFAGRRIDVMSTVNNTLGTPISLPTQGDSGALALSPDSRYLVIANYDNCVPTPTFPGCSFLTGSTTPSLTVIDLDGDGVPHSWPIPTPPSSGTTPAPHFIPYAVEFGNGNQAFLVTSSGTGSAIFLVDPSTTPPTFNSLPPPPVAIAGAALPVTFGTFPPQIVQASSTVSGDGNTIWVLAEGGQAASTATTPAANGSQVLLRYNIPTGTLSAIAITSSPALGPRVISTNMDGSNVLASWALLNSQIVLLAQFPYASGSLNVGSTAWDYSRNLLYAQVPSPTASSPPILHIVDTDNLTVRERIQLPENLAGRAVFSSDMNTLYAISDSGVTVFPIGSFSTAHRVATQEEQLLFQAGSCTNGVITQTLDVIDLGGGKTDFTISVPAGTRGVSFSQVSGTTPAKITVTVDPTAFASVSGTTSIPVTIQSNGSIGIPHTPRLLINTKDPDQRGVIHSLPGTIVDLVADPFRGRIYALRQDRNQVIVMDGTTFNPVATFRTGNTPTKMTFTRDSKYMIVANDNSGIANVYDLDALHAVQFIAFPLGHYPRSIAAANSSMFAVVRNAGTPPALIDQIDFANRVATTPSTLGIFSNSVNPNSVMTASPSGGSIFTASSDGTVLIYNDTYNAFEASRKDLTSLGGSYQAVSDGLFFAGGLLFNASMVQIGPVTGANASSSVLISDSGSNAVIVNADSPPTPGMVDLVTLSSTAVQLVRSIEAPLTSAILTTPQVGQIGQTILSLLNTITVSSNGSTLYLSISGFTELPPGFSQAVPLPSISSLYNSADGGSAAPGSLITIIGSGLASTNASASGLPLPTTLGEVCATANAVAVPLFNVSSGAINAQLPYEVSGAANLVIKSPGGISAPFKFTAPSTATAVFRNGQAGDSSNSPLIYRAFNSELVDFTNPIHPGDTLIIFATGLGQTSPAAVSGAAAPASPLEQAVVVPTITLGGSTLPVSFAGLLPGFVGLYQINASVPPNIKGSPEMPLVISQNSSSTTFSVRVVTP